MNLTIKEVSLCTGWRYRWIFEQIEKGNLRRAKDTLPTGQRGRPRTLVPLHSLPAYAQQKHLAFIAQKELAESGFPVNGRDYGIHKLLDNPKELELALHRFKVVQELMSTQGLPATGRTEKIEKLAQRHNESTSTLYRWRHRWTETHSLASLVRKERSDKGRIIMFSPDAIRFLLAKFYKINSKKKSYHLLISEAMRHEGEWIIGSYKQACRILAAKKSAATHITVQGNARTIMDKVVPSITRKPPDIPNERWSGDHHQCDVFVRHHTRLVRPWLTAWQDECTRAIVGYCLALQPSGRTIAIALRHGILRKPDDDTPFHGIPVQVHVDNGADYTGYYLSGTTWRQKHHKVIIDREIEGVFSELGIQEVNAGVKNAKSKIIERWFGTFEEQFGKAQPGYCGADAKKKPQAFLDAWQRYERKVQGWHRDWLTWEAFVEQFAAYVRFYNSTVHRTIGMKPMERWAQCVHAGFIPNDIDSSRLDSLLMPPVARSVTEEGIQMFGLLGFYRNYEQLFNYIGSRVIVRYDPMNRESVEVYSDEKKWICTATYDSPVAFGAEDEIAKKIAQQKRNAKFARAMAQDALSVLDDKPRFDTGKVIEDKPVKEEKPKSSYMDDLEMIPVWEDE